MVPALACYGKAISGGFPLAAIVGSAEIMSVLDAPADEDLAACVREARERRTRIEAEATSRVKALDAALEFFAGPVTSARMPKTGTDT